MQKLLTILFIFPLSFTSFADEYDDEENKPLKMVINVADFQPSILSMKKAILRVIIQNNWKIQYQDRNSIIAQYNKSANLKHQ